MRGANGPAFTGGRLVGSRGYVRVLIDSHPKKVGSYVDEHILIAEQALGHYLPQNAVVHHWDENPSNNTTENLLICEDENYHRRIHARMRRIKDTGDLSLKRCAHCKQVKTLTAFPKTKAKWDGRYHLCRMCNAEYIRQRRFK